MTIKIVKEPVSISDIAKLAEGQFGDFVKAVVDIERGIMALGGELHADEETSLLESGSKQENLWGINIYPALAGGDLVEFDSMINVRPAQGNRSRGVDDPALRQKILEAVRKLVRS